MDDATKKGIPDWFNLSWYEETRTYGLKEWAHVFSVRHTLLNPQNANSTQQEAQNHFQKTIIDLCDENKSLLTAWAVSPPKIDYIDIDPYDSLRTPTVESITPVDVFNLHNSLNKEYGDFDVALENAFKEGIFTRHNWDVVNKPVDLMEVESERYPGEDRCHLTVDLYAPKKQIMQDLETWVSSAIETFNVPGSELRFTEATLSRWRDSKVLPYLDLIIWAKLFEQDIPQKAFVDALFPNDYAADTDKIRKTTKKHAVRVMRDSTIAAMRKQLEAETSKTHKEM